MAEMKTTMVVGLSGLGSVGKTTLGKKLAEEFDFPIFRTSTHLRELAAKKGMTKEEFEMKALREGSLEKEIFEPMKKIITKFSKKHKLIILDQIYGATDLAFFSRIFGRANICVIDVRAREGTRKKRFVKREKPHNTIKHLMIDDKIRIKFRYLELSKLSDITILNSGTLKKSCEILKKKLREKAGESGKGFIEGEQRDKSFNY